MLKKLSFAMVVIMVLSTVLCFSIFATDDGDAIAEETPIDASNQAAAPEEATKAAAVVDDGFDPELATDIIQREITFAKYEDWSGLSDREIGIEKLIESGMPQFVIEAFDEETLESFAYSDECIQTVAYFGETYDAISDQSELVSISQAEFVATERAKLDELDIDPAFSNLIFPDTGNMETSVLPIDGTE